MRQVIWERDGARLEFSTALDLYFLYINGVFERDFETKEAANLYMKRRNGEPSGAPTEKLD